MNCYLCYQQAGNATRPALGICHLCGAGICEHHLAPVTSQAVIGMAGLISTSRSLRCTHCLEGIARVLHPVDRHTPTKERRKRKAASWLQHRIWRRPHPLPEPAEAVALVERFLKQH